jgi:predicted rRNA methylase YqxC with S4 and FtsJ domains
VVRDPEKRLAAIRRVLDWAAGRGFGLRAELDSPIPGPRGNLERLVLLDSPRPEALEEL